MHRNSIACGGGSQGWREGGGEVGGMIPTVGKRTVRFSPVILFKIAGRFVLLGSQMKCYRFMMPSGNFSLPSIFENGTSDL